MTALARRMLAVAAIVCAATIARAAEIPLDERKRIFERFVRGKSAAGKQVRGSGIGLALVKHIAEAHGGAAWVEDNKPRGSCFVITLRA